MTLYVPALRFVPRTVSLGCPVSLEPTTRPSGSMTVRISSLDASGQVMLNVKFAWTVLLAPAGTFTVTECWSASVELSTNGEQSLVAFAPGGIAPVQVSVTVWPVLVGTVTLLEGGLDAWEAPAPARPTNSPAASRTSKTRRLSNFATTRRRARVMTCPLFRDHLGSASKDQLRISTLESIDQTHVRRPRVALRQ